MTNDTEKLPTEAITPLDLEYGIAAAEQEGLLNVTASQVLAIYKAMRVNKERGRPTDEEMVERAMDEILRLEGERDNGPFVFSYVAVEQGIRNSISGKA